MSMRIRGNVLMLGLALLGASACGDDGKRPLGASCNGDDECASGLCVDNICLDPLGDEDGDGVLNQVELLLATDPFDPDSDGDGLLDGAEVGPDPAAALDSDGDGLSDAIESASADADLDCVNDQLDAETRDQRNERAREVCRVVGLCADRADALGATCQVVDGAVVWACDPAGVPGYAASDARCDGVDEDCDGTADEDFVGVGVTCAPGDCAATGLTRCVDGAEGTTCGVRISDTDATCDGFDDDCDGATDEEVAATQSTCGVGTCAATGTLACVGGRMVDDCVPGEPAAADAVCDGLDEDCDGARDEDHIPVEVSCGEGACRALGTATCVGGEVVVDCSPREVAASDDASCDGIDSDCDAITDEDYAPTPITCGVGACERAGTRECDAGVLVEDCTPGAAAALDDDCDGVDDDCSGVADEDYESATTTCGIGACARQGALVCAGGAVVDTCVAGEAQAADSVCDGVDEDCDGAADEDYVAAATTCGVGGCERRGERACRDGEVVDTCAPGAPAAADTTCDGVDEDCDRAVDEDVPVEGSRCGVGACAASGEVTCAAGALVDSCEPLPPDCSGRQCGDDGCGGSCGSCPPPAAGCLTVSCGPQGQCETAIAQGFCYIAGVCFSQGDGNPDNDCQLCEPSADASGWSNAKRGAACGDDGNTCSGDICDGLGTCTHPTLPDLTACNDGRSETTGDWCASGVCGGFFARVEPRVSPSDQGEVDEAYRDAGLGPSAPSVAANYWWVDARGRQVPRVAHYSTGAAPPALEVIPALDARYRLALAGTRVVAEDTMWEYVGGQWSSARLDGTLRAVWGYDGNEFPSTFERLHGFTFLNSRVVGAGRAVADTGLAVRGCSYSLLDGVWTCNTQEVATADYASYVAGIVRYPASEAWPLLFVNAGSARAAPTSMKVLAFTSNQWRAEATLGRAIAKEVEDVAAIGGWIVGMGASNLLWVTKLDGYHDIAVPGASASTRWKQAMSFRGHVVVVGQVGGGDASPSTTVVLAYAPSDEYLSDSSRWKLHTVWSGQTLVVNGAVAPSDNELYLLGGDRLGTDRTASTVRAAWRFTTSATPL